MRRGATGTFSRTGMLTAGLAMWAGLATGQGMLEADAATLEAQWEQYLAPNHATPVEMAPTRATAERVLADGATLRLTALAPAVNRWYLVELAPAEGRSQFWHLENADAENWVYGLSQGEDPALVISGPGTADECRPWAGDNSELARAAASGLPYAPICDGKAYLRNRVSGSKSNREAVSDFLRNNIIFGDKLVNLIKGTFFEDAFLEEGETDDGADAGAAVAALGTAKLDQRPVMRSGMALPVVGADAGMEAGSWYAVDGADGVYASVMQPYMISREITSVRNGANGFDGVENGADVYLVAFDMAKFELGYELGTDHPNLGWSSRPSRQNGDWNLPGPDGFNRPDPLVLNGMLSPALTGRAVAAFAGGFKRDHGAFRYGDYAGTERGHHYGFLQDGVTFSRIVPDLSTLYVTTDGDVGMKTWTAEDADAIPSLAFARQNGVPLVERNAEGVSVPGDRVTQWGPGNWSGSAEAQLRTLRSGVCTRNTGGKTFLIYGYFSAATPSTLARTFQAYDCDYAMQLDMNAPELTYLAVFRQNDAGNGLEAMHLSGYMTGSDPVVGGVRVPRFVNFSDSRDFFYLVKKE